MQAIRQQFEADGNGVRATALRSALLDDLVQRLWSQETASEERVAQAMCVVAVGGYGRSQLFPCSDVDLLFCSEKSIGDPAKHVIRRVSQALWDCGLRASPATRTLAECERFSSDNVEFGLALLDRRLSAGSQTVFAKFNERVRSKMLSRDVKSIRAGIVSMTRERHAKYGNTLFHLEPNIKDCPGGLRDANVCGWLAMLSSSEGDQETVELRGAREFLFSLRCFLHYRHERDDNTLDWQAQDAAALQNVGHTHTGGAPRDASTWMRAYFRNARAIDRALNQSFEMDGLRLPQSGNLKRVRLTDTHGFSLKEGQVFLDTAGPADPAADPETVLGAFAAVAKTGAKLSVQSEERIADALPLLAAHLDDWPALWTQLSAVLTGPRAGAALRSMHAIGLLELILPEFHGIDALVIRDAYHRYTVDEHTFVLIDVLHDLELAPLKGAPDWRVKFGEMIRELHHSGALFLAALLHDTGKGRVSDDHAAASAQIARAVMARLDLDSYDAELVLRLIETHLEMSAALRRDIFDLETVKAFAAKVQTQESLRMLTLFTYADIQAVHPDALTPWKAENLWRLSMRAANQMDRNVDEERIHARGKDERVAGVLALLPSQRAAAEIFLEGFPERFLQTRTKEAIVQNFLMTLKFDEDPFQLAFHYGEPTSEITLVTRDKPRLFSSVAGALAAWGMNVVTAEAFANASGVVVDTFRFIDTYRTLELNDSERSRFISSVRDMVAGVTSIDMMLKGRRGRRKRTPRVVVDTRIEFDAAASPHSTLLQVVAQDATGLLRAISQTLSGMDYNVEVALIDTEGETAIDVFYLTRDGKQLDDEQQAELSTALRAAIEANAA